MTVPTGVILRASCRFNRGGYGDVMNVYHFQTDFSAPQAQTTVFDGIDTLLTGVYQGFDEYLDADLEPIDMKVDVVTFQAGKWAVTANVGFGAWGAGINTQESADAVPPGAAVLVKLRTSLGKHLGRKFIGWFTELMNQDGFVTSTLVTALLTAFAALTSNYTISAGNILHNVIPDNATGVVRDITEIAVSGQWAYQRRRKPGVGS